MFKKKDKLEERENETHFSFSNATDRKLLYFILAVIGVVLVILFVVIILVNQFIF